MASLDGISGNDASGVPFLVGGLYVLGAVAAYCSSPQTTELNAGARSGTLMKWVKFGAIQSVGFIGIAALIDEKHRTALLAGGGIQLVLMVGAYMHARDSGLSSSAPPTEQYAQPQPQTWFPSASAA